MQHRPKSVTTAVSAVALLALAAFALTAATASGRTAAQRFVAPSGVTAGGHGPAAGSGAAVLPPRTAVRAGLAPATAAVELAVRTARDASRSWAGDAVPFFAADPGAIDWGLLDVPATEGIRLQVAAKVFAVPRLTPPGTPAARVGGPPVA